jgi:hypothetical protein
MFGLPGAGLIGYVHPEDEVIRETTALHLFVMDQRGQLAAPDIVFRLDVATPRGRQPSARSAASRQTHTAKCLAIRTAQLGGR